MLDALRGQHSAWSLHGQELAFVPMPYSPTTLRGMITGQRKRIFEIVLRDPRRVKDAAIPVEQIQGTILLASFTRENGIEDVPVVPAMAGRRRAKEISKK